ncbi:MAG: PH domain-containing protein [Alphaproteobacteria bacterium]|nr:PH domain-containing protein [Alphaproteobacteria bacterium]MBU0864833.1 PH domain-containing protein [Alphaproteobacteria bacterium]MBU1826533.1 PH domain-containing protein [Alphaproteobacteria bacterium]
MPEVLDRFRSSTWGWLRGTLLGWLTLLLCLVGIGFLIILIQWIRNWMVTYELTQDRLILRQGILVKSIDEIELYRVKNVRLDFTLINQWAGIGTISIDSSDETTRAGALVIPHIERAAERREEMRTLVDAARQKRRVRELDVSSDFL